MNRMLLSAIAFLAVASAAPAYADGLPPVTEDEIVLGKPDAAVTVVEYASMTCPHCAKWETEVLPEVRKEFIDTGKIRFVFRDYPLDGVALRASVIARCAGPQRAFGFIETMFQSQVTWATAKDPVSELKKLARLGGLSGEQVDACLTDQKRTQAIVASRQAGDTAGVDSTPTFFFNGKKVTGEIALEDFRKYAREAGGNS